MRKTEKHPEALIIDLGCRLNQADSAAIATELKSAGFELPASSSPDLIIVNSCAVTAPAAAKSFAAIRKLKRENPEAFVILTGCAASVKASPPPKDLPIDLALPNESKADLAKIAAARFGLQAPCETPAQASYNTAKTRAYLKIQDGCDNFCAFCIVPFARGRERSPDAKTLLDNTKQLLDAGYREIVLTGVNISTYNSEGTRLPELLERMAALPGDFRLRLGSTEPDETLPRIVDTMSRESKICHFLHMPLQHGSESMLKSMGRRCTAKHYAELVACAREKIPGIHIGADIIAGLPGETASIFEESRHFIENLDLANMHVFSYSARKGTRAASMSAQVPAELIKERHDTLMKLAKAKSLEYALSHCGSTLRVLTERSRNAGMATGWSDNYQKVIFPLQKTSRNEFYAVKITSSDKNGILHGEALSN